MMKSTQKMISTLVFCGLFVLTATTSVEAKAFIGIGECVVQKNDTVDNAKNTAFKKALADISEQAALAVKGYYASQNGKITENIIKKITVSMIKITKKDFAYETTADGLLKINASITADVDVEQAAKLSAANLLSKDNEKGKSVVDNSLSPAKESKNFDWWENEKIIAEGIGFPIDSAQNPGEAKATAKQAAMLDAYRKLAEQAAGIHITANQTLTQGEVEAVITGATVIKEEYDEYNNCTVVLSVPLYGVENSVAKAAFSGSKKEKTHQPLETTTKDKEQHYTGLIIDCSDLTSTEKDALRPVLSPIVKSTDGKNIYSADNVSLDTIVKGGMVSYSDAQRGNRKRAGDNPLIAKATALADNNTNPILTPLDANIIERENRRSNFLAKGSVVLVGMNINVNSGATSDDDGYV